MREILSDSPLDDLSTMGVVQRLMSDGVLMHGAPVTPRRKPSLQQWLGSVPPPPREAAEASSPDGAAVPDAPPLVVDTPPEGQPGAAAKVQPDAGAATRPDAPEVPTPPRGGAPVRTAGPIALVRYPPLRGMRRERLRREAEEARQAMTAGRPVRLTHILELPATPGGGDAMPQGARRMSVAVGEAAKRFAPDLPVARVVRPWIAPGASPDPGTAEAAARPRRGNGDAGSDEISAALADCNDCIPATRPCIA